MERYESKLPGSSRRAAAGTILPAVRSSLRPLLVAGLASAGLNILALTGSVYALQIYNHVLPARRLEGLLALTLAMLGLYGLAALVDIVRLHFLSLAARRVDGALTGRVFAARQRLALAGTPAGDGQQPMRDLDQLRAFVAGAGATALFDLPFMPLFLGAIFLLHPLLGALALGGAAFLIRLMLAAEPRRVAGKGGASADSGTQRWAFAASALRNAEPAHAMGMLPRLTEQWCSLNGEHLAQETRKGARTNAASAAIRAARPALQSGMLGLGAYLALSGEGSAGAMLAASILLSRALAPVEGVIAHWRSLIAARHAAARLDALLGAIIGEPVVAPRACARPYTSLSVEGLTLAPPGADAPVVRNLSFRLDAGSVLGVIGPNGAGKSTLARALVGVWRPRAGAVRIDGRALPDWDTNVLGRHIGYLPQDASLLHGTIGGNIARFETGACAEDIAAAARAAGVAPMIEALSKGYDTEIGASSALSAGQRQRIALARALYGQPFLVVLDEPDSSLDAEGLRCLSRAIAAVRRRGGIVVVMAHRRALLAHVDQVLVLARGGIAAKGPADAVLGQLAPREQETA